VATAGITVPTVTKSVLFADSNIAWARSNDFFNATETERGVPLGSCRMPPVFDRFACFVPTGDEIATVKYIRENSDPGNRILVANGRHDKVFANNITLYFLVGALPITHWHQFDPGLQTTANVQRDIVREVEKYQPKLIVADKTWDNMSEPNASASSSGVTILDDYLSTHYNVARQFGPISVLNRKPTP
jgi:hypothetical protein